MTSTIIEKFVGSINSTHRRFYNYTQNLTEKELFRQPSRTAPPIGWHIWHIARWGDMLQASFPGNRDVWLDQNLAAEFGIDAAILGPFEMGMGMSHEDACHIAVTIGRAQLAEYMKTASDLCEAAMRDLQDDDLLCPRISMVKLDFSTDPPTIIEGKEVPLVRDLDFHKDHGNRHLGMIEGLIGVMFEREGTATI